MPRTGDVPASHRRAPAAMVALLVIVAAALAWLGAGCSSSAIAPAPHDGAADSSDTGTPQPDAAADHSSQADVTTDTVVPHTDAADTSIGPTDAGCALGNSYAYGPNGGLVAFTSESTLTPPALYRRTTTYARIPDPPAPLSCTPPLPACGDATLIDVSDIVRDLADPDVVQALATATPPLYGLDQRPVDGTMFQVLRVDGHGFLAGGDCDTGAFCHGPVPAGIARLVADLKALDQQQLADPSCASLNPPP